MCPMTKRRRGLLPEPISDLRSRASRKSCSVQFLLETVMRYYFFRRLRHVLGHRRFRRSSPFFAPNDRRPLRSPLPVAVSLLAGSIVEPPLHRAAIFLARPPDRRDPRLSAAGFATIPLPTVTTPTNPGPLPTFRASEFSITVVSSADTRKIGWRDPALLPIPSPEIGMASL